MTDQAWDVVVPEALREQIRFAISDLAEHVPRAADPSAGDKLRAAALPHEITVGVSQGAAGRELFHWHRTASLLSSGKEEARVRLLEWAAGVLLQEDLQPDLFGGLTGLLWLYGHVAGATASSDATADEVFADFDNLLIDWVSGPNLTRVDVVSGLCGVGVYALERLPSRSASRCLDAVVEKLRMLAQWDARGAWWLSPPGAFNHADAPAGVEGWCDLGMAHGAGGVIGLLAQWAECGMTNTAAGHLLEAATDFAVATSRDYGNGTDLPSVVAVIGGRLSEHHVSRERPAWCYSSLGAACAIARAGAVTGNPAWTNTAIRMARAHAARTDRAWMFPDDTGLCHGLAGNAHMFNRLSQRTGDQLLRDTAVTLYERLLATRRTNDPATVAGFRTLFQRDLTNAEWIVSFGLLYGAAGIGLALLAAAEPAPPTWDRLFLI